MKLQRHDGLLLALAVATAVAIYFALGSVGTGSSPLSEAEGSAATSDVGQDIRTSRPGELTQTTPASAEAAQATTTPASDAARVTEEPADGSLQTSTSPPSSQRAPADELFSQILAGQDDAAVDVVVLGDDTSNLRSEWVHLWGQELSAAREVTVVQWAEMVDIQYAEPEVLSTTGAGGPLTIWSASRSGADIESVTRRLELFLEPDPDLLLINLGTNNDDPDEAVQQLQALVDELRDRIGATPLALVRQGQDGAGEQVDRALAAWAHQEGLFVIDARTAEGAQAWAELVVEQTQP